MARHLAGTTDKISLGSDASIDDFTTKTVALWTQNHTGGVTTYELVTKSDGGGIMPTGWRLAIITNAGTGDTGHLLFTQDFSTTDGSWTTDVNTFDATAHHVSVTYDRSATANDPVIRVDGTSLALMRTPPVGTSNGDAAQNLLIGRNDGGTNTSLTGDVQNFLYDNTILTAAQLNRHRWWGRVGGAVKVLHPFYTGKLANEGSATADAVLTGTSVTSLPRTERS